MKIRNVKGGGQIFYCPGCQDLHQVNTSGPRWTYNNDPNKPTFSPSIKVTVDWKDCPEEICHSYVTDGRIQFLNDCTHSLAGQTVDIPEWPYALYTFVGIDE